MDALVQLVVGVGGGGEPEESEETRLSTSFPLCQSPISREMDVSSREPQLAGPAY